MRFIRSFQTAEVTLKLTQGHWH